MIGGDFAVASKQDSRGEVGFGFKLDGKRRLRPRDLRTTNEIEATLCTFLLTASDRSSRYQLASKTKESTNSLTKESKAHSQAKSNSA